MRKLTMEEIELVAGGALTSVNVTADRPPDNTPTNPPPNTGTDPGAGNNGSGGGSGTGSGGHMTTSQAIHQVGTELGKDLASMASHSATLSKTLTDLVNKGWHFKFHAGSSETDFWGNEGPAQTIYINQAYKANINQVVQQLSHELGHAEFVVMVNASAVTCSQYVAEKLDGEGHAAFYNAAVEHEIEVSTGIDIGMASANPTVTSPLYANEYQQYLNNPYPSELPIVYTAMANTYGAYEHVSDGRTYRQFYTDDYYAHGGKK